MFEMLPRGLEVLGMMLKIIGSSALVLGFVIVTVRYFRQYFQQDATFALQEYRQSLGRVILIGLEILIAATIIQMIAFSPTEKKMVLLAIVIVIRTILGWTTVLEMDGRWPWQTNATN